MLDNNRDAAHRFAEDPRARDPMGAQQRRIARRPVPIRRDVGSYAPPPPGVFRQPMVSSRPHTPRASVTPTPPQAVLQSNGAVHMQCMTFRDTSLPDQRLVGTIAQAARAGDLHALHAFLCRMPRGAISHPVEPGDVTLLHLVARKAPQPMAALHYLVQNGANLEATDAEGMTPLLVLACRSPARQDLRALRYLLRSGASTAATCTTGLTVLHAVVRNNPADPVPALQALIEHGVDVNQPSERGMTPLFVVARYAQHPAHAMHLLLHAYPREPARCANPNAESSMVAKDPGSDTTRTINFGTPLVALALYGANPLPAMEVLVRAHADVADARQLYANVFRVAEGRSFNAVEQLLTRAARGDFADPETPTGPLGDDVLLTEAAAAERAQLPMVEQVHGMEEHTVWSAAEAGRTDLIQHYLRHVPHYFGRSGGKDSPYPLACAARGGNLETVRAIVEALPQLRAAGVSGPGVDINGEYKGMTPLTWSLKHKRQRVVAYLLQQGADPTHKVRHGSWWRRKSYADALWFALKESDVQCTSSVMEWFERTKAPWDEKGVHAYIKQSGNALLLERFNIVMRRRVTGKKW